MTLFDTHTHDSFEGFDEDREEMMTRGKNAGVVGKIQIGCDLASSQRAVDLALLYENMWASVGIHPCSVLPLSELPKALEDLEALLKKYPQKIVALGETGFDFFHADTPELRALQEASLLEHIHFAREYNKTLVIHTRNAKEETLQFFRLYKTELPKRGVFHCFCEDSSFSEFATQELSYFLGIGGTLTYKKNDHIREAVQKTPLEFLVTETDAPYLAPQSYRGKRNESAYMTEVVECIADIKNLPVQKCAEVLVENAKRLFSL
ncbi:MAG: TatD family hydrolase [Candidatus Peregrinibacteria bacterium]